MSRPPPRPGVHTDGSATRFTVCSREAESVWLCLFEGDAETRHPMRREDGAFTHRLSGVRPGQRYGYRADGPWSPDHGLWFDPDKLLVDPYAVELDRRFVQDARLAAPRGSGVDTAALVPKAISPAPRQAARAVAPLFRPGGLIYELNVRGFTQRHPDVPPELRGTVGALAHPAVLAHFHKLGVAAVELMPIVAWIDERHLTPLGLSNAWGYNPVALMALDPGLAPGGVAELEATAAALRAAGIDLILDLVFNHTGESDVSGPTLSMRGLDNRLYYAHRGDAPAVPVNDSGCGNTLAVWRPEVRALVLDTLRHFAGLGVSGFRFDLAPVLARGDEGFDPNAPIFDEIAADPLLRDLTMIAEPWDIGPGGYQLGAFPASFLEWNDRYRDDVRRFWRGDPGAAGALATRIAGSSDIFGRDGATRTRSVNFLAAHDGFTLADLVSHTERHNEANGEQNRDGHGENLSWNCGVEGPSPDPAVLARRGADVRALLATLFASRGTIMLTAGDEFGRSQRGNNNAYAQDNATTWLDWQARDRALEAFTAELARLRAEHPEIADPSFLEHAQGVEGVAWLDLAGAPLTPQSWPGAEGFELRLALSGGRTLALRIDRPARQCVLNVEAGGI